MNRVGVLHLVDTLDAGGAERVAVELVNALPRERYEPWLGTTRREGVLAAEISKDVGRLRLTRRLPASPLAARRLARFVSEKGIRLVHAHSSSILIVAVAKRLGMPAVVVWHDHYGRQEERPRFAPPYRWAMKSTFGAITVSSGLAEWDHRVLDVPSDRVWTLRNFSLPPDTVVQPTVDLPGTQRRRVVCVANLRPQKDHINLLKAWHRVLDAVPDASLLFVGGGTDPAYRRQLERLIEKPALATSVHLLGRRNDIPAILRASDIGVLSSRSEGLPLALLEYGHAELPVVATRVGENPDVLLDGRAGKLVNPSDPEGLAEALITLLLDPTLRKNLGTMLNERVRTVFSRESVIRELDRIYSSAIRETAPR